MGIDSTLTDEKIARLSPKITKRSMESIALTHMKMDNETVNAIDVIAQNNPHKFTRDIIFLWRNKNPAINHVKVSNENIFDDSVVES